MLTAFVDSTVRKLLGEGFPHLQYPAVLQATITSASEDSEEYEYELKAKEKPDGEEKEYIVTGKWWRYNLRILDNTGSPDERFPEIPGILSQLQVKDGAMVAVGLPSGELVPVILCEVK